MFIQSAESAVFSGKFIKQLSMRQLMDITENMKSMAGYNQAAEMVYLSYFNNSACTERMFNSGGAVLETLPPAMFNSAVNEVMVFNGISDSDEGVSENPM